MIVIPFKLIANTWLPGAIIVDIECNLYDFQDMFQRKVRHLHEDLSTSNEQEETRQKSNPKVEREC